MRVLVAIAAVSALDAFLARNDTFERNLPSQGSFLDKSHETIQHVRSDLKELFKTVGELRNADLDEVSRQRQNYVGKLHSQEEEVRRQATANDKLQADNEAILQAIHGLEEQKTELQQENAQLESRLKNLKGQVEQEVSGLQTLLGGSAREASVLESDSVVGKTDEESVDDDKSDDSDDADDDAKDDAKSDEKDDAKDSKDDDSDDADAKDDDKDDDTDDDKDDDKQSLAKTGSNSSETSKAVTADADKDDDKDDDADDDKDDDDDDAPQTAALQVGDENEEACHCLDPCNKAQKPICFVQSTQCRLKQNCDKGAKGSACIKTDPAKGPWTLCANVLNATVPKEAPESLIPENPNVAVALRMLADVRREITGITLEDDEGARKLREAYRDEKATEEHKRKEVLDHEHELQQQQEDDLQKKAKLADEVHVLQEKNKTLRRNVDRIGEFLKGESSKLSDAVSEAKATA